MCKIKDRLRVKLNKTQATPTQVLRTVLCSLTRTISDFDKQYQYEKANRS